MRQILMRRFFKTIFMILLRRMDNKLQSLKKKLNQQKRAHKFKILLNTLKISKIIMDILQISTLMIKFKRLKTYKYKTVSIKMGLASMVHIWIYLNKKNQLKIFDTLSIRKKEDYWVTQIYIFKYNSECSQF